MVRGRPNPVTSLNVPIVGDKDGRCESDALRIAGEYSPGVCRISKGGLDFKWQQQSGYGVNGGVTFIGQELTTFDCVFEFFRQDQIDDFAAWQKKHLLPSLFVQKQLNSGFLPNTPRPKALAVYHPSLAEVGINACVPTHIGLLSETGVASKKWAKAVTFLHWRPPFVQLGKPKAPIPDTKKVAPTALDAAQLQMRSLRQDIQARLAAIARGHR